jgi:transposase-like protein
MTSPGDNGKVETASRPQRWSAKQKRDVVLRLLRGESLEAVSAEIGVPAHLLDRWRLQFLEAGRAGLRMRAQGGRGAGLRGARAEIAELKARIHLLERALRLATLGTHPMAGGDAGPLPPPAEPTLNG